MQWLRRRRPGVLVLFWFSEAEAGPSHPPTQRAGARKGMSRGLQTQAGHKVAMILQSTREGGGLPGWVASRSENSAADCDLLSDTKEAEKVLRSW